MLTSDDAVRRIIRDSVATRRVLTHQKKKIIGVGHALSTTELKNKAVTLHGTAVTLKEEWSVGACRDLLYQDLEEIEKYLEETLDVQLTEEQHDSLVTFIYVTGISTYAPSRVRKIIDTGLFKKVPREMTLMYEASGGLGKRFLDEKEIWYGKKARNALRRN